MTHRSSLQQFASIPPLELIADLFTSDTGCPFTTGVTWNTWKDVSSSSIEPLRAFIRPSHQGLLNQAVAPPDSTRSRSRLTSFLRQVLRTHDYTLDAVSFKGPWALAREGDRLPVVNRTTTRRVLFGSG